MVKEALLEALEVVGLRFIQVEDLLTRGSRVQTPLQQFFRGGRRALEEVPARIGELTGVRR